MRYNSHFISKISLIKLSFKKLNKNIPYKKLNILNKNKSYIKK